MSQTICSIEGCSKAAHARGWCGTHYARWQRLGTTRLPPRLLSDVEERFWSKVEKSTSCWIWTATLTRLGYGHFRMGEKLRSAHRVAYELLVGPIPEGMTLDHLCRKPACVNPDHLEPVTQHENILRGKAPAAINARKTHCVRGHPLSGENLYIRPNGHRRCRACKNIGERRRRYRSTIR